MQINGKREGKNYVKYRIYQKLKRKLREVIAGGKTGRKKVPVLHDQPGRHQRIIALQSEIYRW